MTSTTGRVEPRVLRRVSARARPAVGGAPTWIPRPYRCTLTGGRRAPRPLLIELYATGEALLAQAQAHCTES